mgnify:CR=1 FL=1
MSASFVCTICKQPIQRGQPSTGMWVAKVAARPGKEIYVFHHVSCEAGIAIINGGSPCRT